METLTHSITTTIISQTYHLRSTVVVAVVLVILTDILFIYIMLLFVLFLKNEKYFESNIVIIVNVTTIYIIALLPT